MSHTHVFKDNQAVAEAFAEYLYQQVEAAGKYFHLALSGGTTPKVLFDHLAEAYADRMDWDKVHLYWGDERCVAHNDPQSNFFMTSERLIDKVPISPGNIHRIVGELLPEREARRYPLVLQEMLPMENGRLIFDLIMLGMGSDGHTASIFPHQMELLTAEETCAVAVHPDTGQRRITLTGEVINAARQIHFLVTGASKRPVVTEIFTHTGRCESYPAYHIRGAQWWMDEAAAPSKE
ncbi:MAG: 6-phosphogluconolactonase [Bacteroidota bacterium]